VRINHYVCKSKSEQQKREKNSAAWYSKMKSEFWEAWCEKLFVSVKDDSIDRFIEAK
jgi:hypothetical protein